MDQPGYAGSVSSVTEGLDYSPANERGMTISTLPAARLRLQPHLPRVLRQVRHVRGRLGLRHDVADPVDQEEQLALHQPVDGMRRAVEALDRGEDLQPLMRSGMLIHLDRIITEGEVAFRLRVQNLSTTKKNPALQNPRRTG